MLVFQLLFTTVLQSWAYVYEVAYSKYCEALNNETDAWALYMYELEILNNMLKTYKGS